MKRRRGKFTLIVQVRRARDPMTTTVRCDFGWLCSVACAVDASAGLAKYAHKALSVQCWASDLRLATTERRLGYNSRLLAICTCSHKQ